MTSKLPWICDACVHYDEETRTCPAFPDGIPLKPLKDPILHDEVLPGQVGDTVFQPKDDVHSLTIYDVLKQAVEATEEVKDE